MARLIAVADGNNTAASTWALVDSTSYNESEGISITVPTSYSTSYTQFTPGAITIDGIAVRLSNRTGTTGTFSVELYNHTAGASVAGTEVTINCSDFLAATQAAFDGGWYFFKFSAVTLLAANAYSVRFKTSSVSQITLFGTGSTNPSRMLRTTTTQAPVATDDRFIMQEWTAAATSTTRAVTGNDTTVVDYGSGSTSQVTPALSISAGGSYLVGTSASTAYNVKISGNVVVYNGGVLKMGETAGRMPTTSSLTWLMDCVSNVDFGIDVRNGGTCYGAGADKTRHTLLTGDEAAAQTVIGVADTTGWATGDTLGFAPTGTTNTHGETKDISTVDSGVQVTLSAGLTNAHTGTGDVVGEVGNLTSNVKIIGTSTSVGTFICFRAGSIGVFDNVECRYLGSATANKRGVESQHINTSSNSMTLNKCVFRDILQNGVIGGNGGSSGAFFYVSDCIVYSLIGSASTLLAAGGAVGTPTFDLSDNLVIGGGTGVGITIAAITGAGGTVANNISTGCNNGISVTATFTIDTVTNFSGFKVHSNAVGMVSSSAQKKTITSCDFVCNSSSGVTSVGGICDFVTCNFYGNSAQGVAIAINTAQHSALGFTSCNFRGRSGFAQPIGYSSGATYGPPALVVFNSCSFGATTAHTTSDISISGIVGGSHIFNNCTFSSTTEFNSTIYTFLDENAIVGVQRKDTTAGNHVAYIRQGIITRDTTIYNTASPSLRIEPKSASIEAKTRVKPFAVPVNSGQTCTPSVYVRESVSGDGTDYNGNRVKLYVKQNYNLGITSDTLLDTATGASEGAFELLTGTTAAVTDDGVLEFYLTCDGTTGWVNIDDFTATVA